MFDFKSLKFEKRAINSSKNSFVGIRRNANQEIVFRLPLGFENFPENNFNFTKDLFFKMYRTFRKFEHDMDNNLKMDERPSGKDQIEKGSNAYRFTDGDGESVLLYSKIRIIEDILQIYDELSIDTITRKLGISDKIGYSKIDRYLHKAIYLPNGVAYVDEMEALRNIILYSSNDLVEMFCFILHEIQKELEQEVDEQVKSLSVKFQEKHLSSKQSLFDEYTFQQTISLLKDALDKIEKRTAYKDNDFWRIFEVIEAFLYNELDLGSINEEGIFWGISKFDMIWEQMCSTFAVRNFNDILYADTNVIVSGSRVGNKVVGGCRIFIADEFENPFYIEFRSIKRWFRPDLLRKISLGNDIEYQSNENHFGRRDFKIKMKSQNQIHMEFINRLKKRMKRIKGAVNVENNHFKNYPVKDMEEILSSMTIFAFYDWKYHPVEDYTQGSNAKVKSDVRKQLVYEASLQNEDNANMNIESRFIVPYYYGNTVHKSSQNDIGEFIEEKNLINIIKENKIKIFKANFIEIQKEYLLER